MSVFNDNLRFLCKKMGLSQQKLADMMGTKRGKVSGYFYKTQPKPEFYDKLGSLFEVNIGRMLTFPMTDETYDSFFLPGKLIAAEEEGEYTTRSELIDLLMEVKKESDVERIHSLVDKALMLYGKILDENSKLKDVNSELKDQLLKSKKGEE